MRRAWHAGASCWDGVADLNSHSIGIEIGNPGHEHGYRDFPSGQVAAVMALCRDILARWPIPAHRVLAHSDIAPHRKEDPGEKFPWQTLHAAGIGAWVTPAPLTLKGPTYARGDRGPEVIALQDGLRRYGYAIEAGTTFNGDTEGVVRAFQRHFRPTLVDGRADASTLRTLSDLLKARGLETIL
jgi:N-acetylmuramoyl-L-alanine amidase